MKIVTQISTKVNSEIWIIGKIITVSQFSKILHAGAHLDTIWYHFCEFENDTDSIEINKSTKFKLSKIMLNSLGNNDKFLYRLLDWVRKNDSLANSLQIIESSCANLKAIQKYAEVLKLKIAIEGQPFNF